MNSLSVLTQFSPVGETERVEWMIFSRSGNDEDVLVNDDDLKSFSQKLQCYISSISNSFEESSEKSWNAIPKVS